MENKLEEVKIVHSQHARILKEDEEVLWISSEDLNTENSTDDERSKTRRHAFKKKLKLKDRKRSSPNIRLYDHQRSSNAATIITSSSASNDIIGTDNDRLLIPSNEEIRSRSTVEDGSRTSDEEYQIPSLSECLSKRLSLEEWRPMKGALNISSLEETASSSSGETTKIIHETETFYQTMLDNLNSLKSCSPTSIIQKNNLNDENFITLERSFLKNTPEVQNKLDFIIKLDREIDEIIRSYKVEREERLSTQFEMCKIISEEKLNEERDTEMFLQMCNYHEENYKLNQIVQPIISKTSKSSVVEVSNFAANNNNTEDKNDETEKSAACSRELLRRKNFVKKNIYAAKEGTMANLALTDEEKIKVSELLCDIDSFKLNDAKLTLSTTTLTTNKTVEEINDCCRSENAFSLLETDKTRIGEIDNELDQFTDDVLLKEKNSKSIPDVVKDEEFWKNYIIDQSLKEIDSKLEKLYESYKEDEEKLKYILENEKMVDDLCKQEDEIFM